MGRPAYELECGTKHPDAALLRVMIAVEHAELILQPEAGRTVIRPFTPNFAEGFGPNGAGDQGPTRPQLIAKRLLAIPDDRVAQVLGSIQDALGSQHRGFDEMLLQRFEEINGSLIDRVEVSRERALLIGGYFSEEYSFEAAALFNPSMVLHPDQTGVDDDAFRFVVSLRGMGEGHLSSVTFRTGTWRGAADVAIDVPSPYSVPPQVVGREGDRADGPVELRPGGSQDLSEIVLFPLLPSQAGGIEDLRLVHFTDDDGHSSYIGTYTAFSGTAIRSEMLRTTDFAGFEMIPLGGTASKSKGMALFPRKVNGEYMMLGRQDNESVWLHRSGDLFDWNDGHKIISPKYVWDCAQMGNCGSPIEIDEGWLVITHGIGPLRSYSIGAALLDKDDPAKVLGRTPHPLLNPTAGERDGYVPNVLYSCGGLVRANQGGGRRLMLPYGVADNYTRFASIALDDVLAALQ